MFIPCNKPNAGAGACSPQRAPPVLPDGDGARGTLERHGEIGKDGEAEA